MRPPYVYRLSLTNPELNDVNAYLTNVINTYQLDEDVFNSVINLSLTSKIYLQQVMVRDSDVCYLNYSTHWRRYDSQELCNIIQLIDDYSGNITRHQVVILDNLRFPELREDYLTNYSTPELDELIYTYNISAEHVMEFMRAGGTLDVIIDYNANLNRESRLPLSKLTDFKIKHGFIPTTLELRDVMQYIATEDISQLHYPVDIREVMLTLTLAKDKSSAVRFLNSISGVNSIYLIPLLELAIKHDCLDILTYHHIVLLGYRTVLYHIENSSLITYLNLNLSDDELIHLTNQLEFNTLHADTEQ